MGVSELALTSVTLQANHVTRELRTLSLQPKRQLKGWRSEVNGEQQRWCKSGAESEVPTTSGLVSRVGTADGRLYGWAVGTFIDHVSPPLLELVICPEN